MAEDISSKYSTLVYDSVGNLIADLTGIIQISTIDLQRNGSQSAQLTIDLFKMESYAHQVGIKPLDIFGVNINELRIMRGARVVFAGQINYVSPKLSDTSAVLDIKAIGWFDLLAYRLTADERDFSATDAGTIAWTLISETQALTNGSFGITMGTITASTTRDITYSYENLKDAIVKLSEMLGGFDFEVTWDKIFNVYYPYMGVDRSADLIFEYPKNIKGVEFEVDGSQMVNKDTVMGNGYSDTESNSASQAIYKIREKKETLSNIPDLQVLADTANETLRIYKNITYNVSSLTIDGNQDPIIGSYWLGDRITVKVNTLDSFFPITSVVYRIDEITINLDDTLTETIDLKLSTP